MNLKQLKKILNDLPSHYDSHLVICSSDGEGNSYSPLQLVTSDEHFMKEEREIYGDEWTADEAGFNTDKEWSDFKKNKCKPCITLWPS